MPNEVELSLGRDDVALFPLLDLCESDKPPYGASLTDAVSLGGSFTWLEAALHAGYAPMPSGIKVALIATHRFAIARMVETARSNALGDTEGWANCWIDEYEEISDLIVCQIQALRELLSELGVPIDE